MSPEEVIAQARERLNAAIEEAIGGELMNEWSVAANELYKEQFAKKENPYDEPWEYRAGDEKRTKSYYKFGSVADVDRESFSLVVASGRPKRSCVPFEPRGLGRWRPRFDELLQKRLQLAFKSVRP